MADDEFMRKPRGVWPYLWGAWVLMFVLIEGAAIRDARGGDTLTEQVQYVGGYRPHVFLVGFLLFVGWLISHFVGHNSRIWRWGPERKKEGGDG